MANQPGSLPLDRGEALLFLNAIDPEPGALFGFRSLDDRGDDLRLATKSYGRLERGVRQSANPEKDGNPCSPARLLAYMQTLGAGAFFVPNKLDGNGQLKRNVVAIRVLYVDADNRTQVEQLEAFISATGLIPTVLVASGGLDQEAEKIHCYWRMRNCQVAEFTQAQLTLVSRVGTDPKVQDPGHVMRLVGFAHLKREPRQTRIVSINPAIEYQHGEFMRRVRAQPQLCDPWAGGKGTGRSVSRRTGPRATTPTTAGPTARLRVLLDRHGGLITPAVRALLREALAPADGQPGNRHSTLTTIVGRCTQAGWSGGDIRALVLPVINTEWGDGDWSDHFDRIIEWTCGQQAAGLAAMPAAPASLAAAFGAGSMR